MLRPYEVALRLVGMLTAFLPWRILGIPGNAIGWICGGVLRIRRRAVETAMHRAAIADPRAVTSAMYNNLGRSLFELFWLAGSSSQDRDRALDHVQIDPAHVLLEAAKRGPLVIAASHTGNWELVAFAAARMLRRAGRSLFVVAKPLSVGALNVFCMRLRESFGLRVLSPERALAPAIHALLAGDVVAMPIDQVPDRASHGCEVSFLGARALADRAPAMLAQATGATLIVVGAERQGAEQRVRILAEIGACTMHGTRRTDRAIQATVEASFALERFCTASPADWLWLHRRWRRANQSPHGKFSRRAAPWRPHILEPPHCRHRQI
ncbi:MAG: lysophospholipid acyltransferase family protein [Polyangiaceae bacterium]|nr:lysophospholipid acyltransferase family protein [Polyangiaceae bacterium]